jgi:hypothetical protein
MLARNARAISAATCAWTRTDAVSLKSRIKRNSSSKPASSILALKSTLRSVIWRAKSWVAKSFSVRAIKNEESS